MDDGRIHESVEAASKSAVLAALDIAKGLYADGEEQPCIEIEILGEGAVLARHVVKLSILAGDE